MTHLPCYTILNPMMGKMPLDQMKELQGERLAAMARYVYANAPLWRNKFDEAGVKPEDINGLDDLPKIPFCTKAEFQSAFRFL